MRALRPDEYVNSSEWKVIHDPRDQLFYLEARNGKRKASAFTQRSFAEAELATYLTNLSLLSQKDADKRKAKSDLTPKIAKG